MTREGVRKYRAMNPGSNLKTAVTERSPSKGRAKRRRSYCARSRGQMKMHGINCSKTPDKRICAEDVGGVKCLRKMLVIIK